MSDKTNGGIVLNGNHNAVSVIVILLLVADCITMNEPLDSGTYEDSTLKYECYRMDGALTSPNSGKVKLILEVEQ